MTNQNKFYISTAIAYVNGSPHIGHALEFVQADALARYHRLFGDDVFFLTGTDEHGSKIFEKAQELGVATQDFVDKNAKIFMSLKDKLNLSYDAFVRTSNDDHKSAAQKLWKIMFENDDIYKDKYSGNYCVGCEAFMADKDLNEDGNCPIHKKAPVLVEEENYFFRLSKYSNRIKEAIESDRLKIVPENRKKEMLNIIGEEGLHDISFSRAKDSLPWGIPVPNDSEQVMYVWCDALSNYITALGFENNAENFQKYWPADVHLIGKDILRFHAGIWIGMLMSADLPLPSSIYVHGFVTSNGHKMSKSLGNVVDPFDYIDKYGSDALRYFLLRDVPSDDDGDFTEDRFISVYNSELANSLGNLLNRVVMMTNRYVDSKVPEKNDNIEISDFVSKALENYKKSFNSFDLKHACECILELVTFSNKYIDEQKPWIMDKEGDEKLSSVLYDLLELLRFIAFMLFPILPSISEKILKQLGFDFSDIKNFNEEWGSLKQGLKVSVSDPLFPRIE